MAKDGWAEEVLAFWFEELTPDHWYAEDPEAIDRLIRDRFAALHAELAAAPPPAAWDDPETALAAIIVLDQFSRNMFRRKPEAFAADETAAALARNALDKGFDAALPPVRKQFLFMPLMHSEHLSDQERCVTLFEGTPGLEDNVKYAVEHRDIVARFGRFPHRNRALGRDSTDAEKAFLGGHKGFGQ